MHVHWEQAGYLPLFTANGVTGVRIMWGEAHHLQWRKDIEAGKLAGPRLAIAGNIADGPKPFWPAFAVSTPEEGRDAVQRTRADGYDFVKVYNSLPRTHSSPSWTRQRNSACRWRAMCRRRCAWRRHRPLA
jgi:hypothetical protein